MSLSEFDKLCFQRAIILANEAEQLKNLPIGAVISYKDEIIGEGKNAIWSPELSLSKHAEMEAMRSVPVALWKQAREMTLYTTLEPCLMCMGAILLHSIGQIMYGSSDPYGGAETVINHLPTFFRKQFSITEWIGPVLPEKCDSLYETIQSMERIGRTAPD
jgi:tRNA(adenine34) deaminase